MRNLQEVKNAVEWLSPEERIRRLDAAAQAIRESFSDAEWEEVEEAMNEEYVVLSRLK